MKKITAGIISAGLCVALITVGTKTASKVMAEDSDNSTIETVTVSKVIQTEKRNIVYHR